MIFVENKKKAPHYSLCIFVRNIDYGSLTIRNLFDIKAAFSGHMHNFADSQK